jgi:hypothetical protein
MSKRILNKNRLLKYAQYLKESIDPWKLKQSIKSFNRLPEECITIPGDLKDLSDKLTIELFGISLPYNKLINFGGIEVDLKIKRTTRYYSNIDWIKFLNGDDELVVEVPDNFDINYLVSLIIHEIRHMIDFTDENLNSGLTSFDIDSNLRKYNIDKFNDFFRLVYISLEHELVARNNQIYPYIKFKNLAKSESLSILKDSFIWTSIQTLKNFNHFDFINRFSENELIIITNNFIRDCLYDEETKVYDKDDLFEFYKTWNDYFNEISNKWEKIVIDEVDRIYERKIINIDNYKNYKDILKEIWNKISNE